MYLDKSKKNRSIDFLAFQLQIILNIRFYTIPKFLKIRCVFSVLRGTNVGESVHTTDFKKKELEYGNVDSGVNLFDINSSLKSERII